MRNGPITDIALVQVKIDDGGNIWHLRDGVFHRTDGPAFIQPNGNRYWYQYGKLHREDGPAIISGKVLYWYIHGEKISGRTRVGESIVRRLFSIIEETNR